MGRTVPGSPLRSLDFHWADSVDGLAGASEFNVDGDSVPNRRWNDRLEVEQPR